MCAIWDTEAFSLKKYCVLNIKSYCSDVCGYHWRPQTPAKICRNMVICCGSRAVAARGKYLGFMLFNMNITDVLMPIGSRESLTNMVVEPDPRRQTPGVAQHYVILITVTPHEFYGFSNHRQLCSFNSSFKQTTKKTKKPCITGVCEGNQLVTDGLPSRWMSNADNVYFHVITLSNAGRQMSSFVMQSVNQRKSLWLSLCDLSRGGGN